MSAWVAVVLAIEPCGQWMWHAILLEGPGALLVGAAIAPGLGVFAMVKVFDVVDLRALIERWLRLGRLAVPPQAGSRQLQPTPWRLLASWGHGHKLHRVLVRRKRSQ